MTQGPTREVPRPALPWYYSERFIEALGAVSLLHAAQARKGSGVPYVAHLLGTCAIVLEPLIRMTPTLARRRIRSEIYALVDKRPPGDSVRTSSRLPRRSSRNEV